MPLSKVCDKSFLRFMICHELFEAWWHMYFFHLMFFLVFRSLTKNNVRHATIKILWPFFSILYILSRTELQYVPVKVHRGCLKSKKTGLNIKIDIVQKVYDWSNCPFAKMIPPIRKSFWQKDSLITHILFELWLLWYSIQSAYFWDNLYNEHFLKDLSYQHRFKQSVRKNWFLIGNWYIKQL